MVVWEFHIDGMGKGLFGKSSICTKGMLGG